LQRATVITAAIALLAVLALAPEAMAKGAKLRLGDSEYGKVLMNGGGKALYLFTSDARKQSNCEGECAAAWPPFLTDGKPRAGKGLKGKLLGTIRRPDGGRQVTYRSRPLYFYVDDRPGVILCQNVVEFGGTWLLVNRRGRAVR
jgi:predicted lipoprotein with Yx(FWY)xxD motif